MYLSSVSKRKRALGSLYRTEFVLKSGEFICQLLKSEGNYLFSALMENSETILVSIPEKFRNAFYFPIHTYVICSPLNMPKIKGEIVCLLRDEQVLSLVRSNQWPEVFTHLPKGKIVKNQEEETYLNVDMLPPSDHESEEEEEREENEALNE